MITKNTFIDNIQICNDESIVATIKHEIMENEKILNFRTNKITINKNDNIDNLMITVNETLQEIGENPLSQLDIDKIKAYHSLKV